MIDNTTANLKKLELRANHARRIGLVIANAEAELARESAHLEAQIKRVEDHADEPKP